MKERGVTKSEVRAEEEILQRSVRYSQKTGPKGIKVGQ